MCTPSPQGQCCVCGTSTATRCAACLSAGFDLFFCSQEHQRLAWPGHKISCGRGGKSAAPPPLSPDEVDEAKQATKLPRMHEATGMTLQDVVELCLPGECGKVVVQGVIEELTKPEPLPHLPPAAALAALHFVRITLLEQVHLALLHSGSLRRSTSSTIEDGPRRSALPAVQAEQPRERLRPRRRQRRIHDPLYVELHHRLLVQAALESRIAAADRPDSTAQDRRAVGPLFRYRKHTLEAIEALWERYLVQTRELRAWLEGSHANEIQGRKVFDYLEIGKKEAKVHVGGNRIGETGYFFEPTLFVEVAETARINKEEIFGPVGIIHKFKDEADVLRKYYDTEDGLYASIFTRNINRALRFAKEVEAGTITVNAAAPLVNSSCRSAVSSRAGMVQR